MINSLKYLTPQTGGGHVTVLLWDYSAIIQGTWAFQPLGAAGTNVGDFAFANEAGTAQNDQIDYKVLLSAGTYTIRQLFYRSTVGGICTFLIDGASVGTIDHYNGAASGNVIGSITGVVVATSGLKTLSIKMATKNGASSAYKCYHLWLGIFRTA